MRPLILLDTDTLSLLLRWQPRVRQHAADIYANLKRRGELIGEIDILIAGIALAHDMGVATRNIAHFSRIANLHVEDWTR